MKKNTFSTRFQQALNIRNITQAEISKKTNISSSLINKYIKGIANPGSFNLSRIASALNVNEAWLNGYDCEFDRYPELNKMDNEKIDSKTMWKRVNEEISRIPNDLLEDEYKNTIKNILEYYRGKTEENIIMRKKFDDENNK